MTRSGRPGTAVLVGGGTGVFVGGCGGTGVFVGGRGGTGVFVGGAAADRYIIWFFGNKTADVLKIVISGKEGKKIRLKTLALEAGQWFKTYDYILSEVERKFNTGGLFQQCKIPVVNLLFVIGECR